MLLLVLNLALALILLSGSGSHLSLGLSFGVQSANSSSPNLSFGLSTQSSWEPLNYKGGPVMHSPTAYVIFWLPSGYHFESGLLASDSKYESLIQRFLQDLNGSSFLSILTQYPDNTIGSPSDRLQFGGSYLDTTPYSFLPGGNLSESGLTLEITHAINVNGWAEGPNSIFIIFTAENIVPQVIEHLGCGDHSYFIDQFTGKQVVYANIPDLHFGCGLAYGTLTANFDIFADSAIGVVSHELFEAITDPLITGWADLNGYEIADKCQGLGPQIGNPILEPNADLELNGHFYEIQEEWSNQANACTFVGPSTFTDQVTLNYYNNPIHSGDYFSVIYTIGGQTFAFHSTGKTVSILTDPFTSVYIDGSSAFSSSQKGELWCLGLCSDPYSFTSTGGNITLKYYDLLAEYTSYSVSDGSVTQASLFMSLLSAIGVNGSGINGPSEVNETLSSFPGTDILVLRGSTVSFTPEISNATERWIVTNSSYVALFPYEYSAEYYHQYAVNLSGGESGSYITMGFSRTINSSQIWADAGSSLSLLASSNSTWLFQGWSGGSYSGTNNPVSIVVNGSLSEEALFGARTSTSVSSSSTPTEQSTSSASGIQTSTTNVPQAPPPGNASSTTTAVGNSAFSFSIAEEQVAFVMVAGIIGVMLIVSSILFFRRRKNT